MELVRKLAKSTYVDDIISIISGAKDEQQAYQLYLQSKGILKDGGFNLRKFVTNSGPLQQRIDAKEEVPHLQMDPMPVSHSDETYTQATLGTAQPTQFGEQRLLGV